MGLPRGGVSSLLECLHRSAERILCDRHTPCGCCTVWAAGMPDPYAAHGMRLIRVLHACLAGGGGHLPVLCSSVAGHGRAGPPG